MSIFTNLEGIKAAVTFQDVSEGGSFDGGNGLIFNDCNDESDPFPYAFNALEWNRSFDYRQILIGNGSLLQPLGDDQSSIGSFCIDPTYFGENNPTEVIVETNWINFSDLINVKSLNALKLGYTKKGTIYPKLSVLAKDNYFDEDGEWANIPHFLDKDGRLVYYLRSVGEHNYFKFKLSWINTNTNCIKTLDIISLDVQDFKNQR